MADLGAMEFFRAQMQKETETKIETMKNLNIIAAVLGPEKTRTELLPFLMTCGEDVDEVLVIMAKHLHKFVPLVGGPTYSTELFPILEKLFNAEENVVREASVYAIANIVAESPQDLSTVILDMVKRMVAAEWFTTRMSVSGLIANTFGRMNASTKDEMKAIVHNLSKDDTPCVRRSLLQSMYVLGSVVDPTFLREDMMLLLRTLSNDDHAYVRVSAVEQYPGFCENLRNANAREDCELNMLPLIRGAVDEKSWKARFAVLHNFDKIVTSFSFETVTGELLGMLNTVLQDPEAEVRLLACKYVCVCAQSSDLEVFTQQVSGTLGQLIQDANTQVRQLTADNVAKVCCLNSGQVHIHYRPLLEHALRDESAEVRSAVIANLCNLVTSVPAVIRSMAPQLRGMFSDVSWRVRQALLKTLPTLLTHLGVEFFSDMFMSSYISAFSDGVAEVRITATQMLSSMVSGSSAEYIHTNVFPTLRSLMGPSAFYLVRVNSLEAVKYLIMGQVDEAFADELVAITLSATSDTVPNVRIMAVQVLASISPQLDSQKRAQLLPTLAELSERDTDKDVQYFAALALQAAQ